MQVDLKNCTLKVKDGTGTPLEVALKIGEGNITWSEKRNVEYKLNKGQLSGGAVRLGDDVPVEVSIDIVWDYITTRAGQATYTVVELIKGSTSGTATFVSTDADACHPYACDIEIEHAPTPTTCGDKETTTLADFRWESLDADLKAGTMSCTGKCYITEASHVRTTQ